LCTKVSEQGRVSEQKGWKKERQVDPAIRVEGA
jgi:hypothetical protein